jgi:hypothetical protein
MDTGKAPSAQQLILEALSDGFGRDVSVHYKHQVQLHDAA